MGNFLKPFYLAIDQGGLSSRAVLFDNNGGVVDRAQFEVPTQRRGPEVVEHDAEDLLRSVQNATRSVIDRSPGPIKSTGLATQRASVVCWDRDTGLPLSPVISWQDRRNADWMAQLHLDEANIRRRTGLIFSPHYGAGKLRWCLDNLPAVKRAAKRGSLAMGPLASFLCARLLDGQPFVTDPANASRTLLWNYLDGDWDPELLGIFDISPEMLPEVCESTAHFGNLWDTGIALTACTGDQSAVPFAWSEPDPETVFINAGTGAFVQRKLPGDPEHLPGLPCSVLLYREGKMHYAVEGTVNGAGSALAWLSGKTGTPIKNLIDAGNVAEPPLFLNGISGLGSPYWRPDFQTRFVGRGGPESKALAVLESIVFLIAVNLDVMHQALPRPHHIVLTGGLSEIAQLCQLLANITRLSVYRPPFVEATARGVARLAMGSQKSWPAREPHMIFEPDNNVALDHRFDKWKSLMQEAIGFDSPQTANPKQHHPF
jgi:glycerol kinase